MSTLHFLLREHYLFILKVLIGQFSKLRSKAPQKVDLFECNSYLHIANNFSILDGVNLDQFGSITVRGRYRVTCHTCVVLKADERTHINHLKFTARLLRCKAHKLVLLRFVSYQKLPLDNKVEEISRVALLPQFVSVRFKRNDPAISYQLKRKLVV